MAKSTQNCHFLRYDVIRFNERIISVPSDLMNFIDIVFTIEVGFGTKPMEVLWCLSHLEYLIFYARKNYSSY